MNWYLGSDAHGFGVVVELLAAFQTRDVGTRWLAVGFMDWGDRSGDEPVMATK